MNHSGKRFIGLSCLFFALVAVETLFAQPALKVEELNIREGLSQGYVSCILQDREGFLWAGTKNGLNRYDGRRFKVFTSDPFNSFSIAHDFVTSLWEHGDFLLVGTNGGGLNIFHKKTARFYRMPQKLPDGSSFESLGILKITIDVYGNIWLINWTTYLDGNIYKVKLPEGFWERLAGGEPDWAGVSIGKHNDYFLNQFTLSRDARRLYYCRKGILVGIETNTSQEVEYAHPAISHFSNAIEDHTGKLWIGGAGKLLQWDGKNWQIHPAPVKTHFRILHINTEGELMIVTWTEGLQSFQPQPAVAGSAFSQPQGYFNKHTVTQAITDRSGNIWIGTDGFGLFKVNPKLGRFQTYFKGRTIYAQPFRLDRGAFGFFADNVKGIEFSASNNTHPFVVNKSELSGINARGRYAIDQTGQYWVLRVRDDNHCSLLRMSADGRDHRTFTLPVTKSRPGHFASDEQGNIWIGLNGDLLRFDIKNEQFTTWNYRTALAFDHDVRALAQTPDKRWWIGTSGGLVEAVLNGTEFAFNLWKNDPGNPNSLRNDDIGALLVDVGDADLLWIGTKGGGLNRLNTRTGDFFHLTAKDGLPNEVIYGILPDDASHLWLSSNRGLIRYHTKTGDLKNFTEEDGLQSDEFNTWAYAKAPTGELMFGGVSGLNVFFSDDFDDNPVAPEVRLTALKINNHEVSPGDSLNILEKAIGFTEKIRLPFGRNSIALEFAALEFTTPSKNRFRYYLEGAEPEWIHEGSENSAQYLNLAPGSYTFKVMASNNDGVWNETPTTLQIVVLPPWYRTWWAYLIYTGLIAGLIFGYLRFRLRQWQLEQKLALESREAERVRELDQFKTRLYTNITHEFRTPLTVILGTSEHLEKQLPNDDSGLDTDGYPFAAGLKKKLGLIRRNGRSLLELVNQLLDLAKAENNQLRLHLVQGDVVRYVRYIAESFQSLANQGNITLEVDNKLPELIMDYDPEKLRQILSNLISNALKYTPPNGQVTVSLKTKADHRQFIIEVTDTGPGIAPEDLPRVFDRFYQADNAVSKAGGTGIGLALTKELVKLLNGNISVESRPGQGAIFILQLPIRQQAASIEAGQFLLNPEIQRTSELLPKSDAVVAKDADLKPSLLIVEDNADVMEYLQLCLEGHYRLDFAYNGRTGIEQALETVPDLILSDVMMPEKDGFEVCDTLKNDERSSHIPIVLLTAKADVESRIVGLRRGADAYLAKPFHPEELLVTLEKLLENRRRLQARYSRLSLTLAPPAPEATESPAETEIEDAFLIKLRRAVEERLADASLSAEDVCRTVGMGRSNLYAKLSALTGLSFNLYVRSLRLRKAKELLQTSEMNVSEVAWEVGFNDPKYFSRVFAEEFGVRPSDLKTG